MTRRSAVLLAGSLILGGLVGVLGVAVPAVGLHWCPSLGGGYAPSFFYQGVGTTFTVTVQNNIGNDLSVANLMVDFNWDGDTSSNGWDYDFGSGVVPAGSTAEFSQPITPPFATSGTYQVEAQVRGSATGDGSTASCNFLPGNVELRSAPPFTVTASANPTTGLAPLNVAFRADISGGSLPYAFSWTFGDGGTSSSQNPGHTYQRPGTFIARVTVQDGVSNTTSDDVTIVVNVPPLTATATANPTLGDAPLNVSFTATVSGGLPPYTYQWLFGDGSASTAQAIVHRFSSAGTYDALLTARDSLGSSVSTSVSVTVRPPAPQISMVVSLQSGLAPLTITFSATITGGVRPDTYLWDFGDGTTSTVDSPSHRYDRPGTYVATVTTTDALGRAATDTESIFALSPQPEFISVENPILWALGAGLAATILAVTVAGRRKRRRRVIRIGPSGRDDVPHRR